MEMIESHIAGGVCDEDARGRVHTREENWEDIPSDGQESGRKIVFRWIHRGKW